MKKKRHSTREIAAKLAQADQLAAQGKTQSEIAKALGISGMTYHRWRKSTLQSTIEQPLPVSGVSDRNDQARISELEGENAELRRLVTDLMLEKLRLSDLLRDKRSRS